MTSRNPFSKVCCVAAPIRDINGQVHAAMSASVPLQHFHTNRELLQRSIHRAAGDISRSGRQVVHHSSAARSDIPRVGG